MRHVDDGTIHAWLDRQVADPAEVAGIESHLAECGACRERVEAERATLEQAATLLASVAPAVDAGRAAFDALAAGAGASSSGREPRDSRSAIDAPDVAPTRRRGVRTWVLPLSWAASVALAASLGWALRDRGVLESTGSPEARLALATSESRVPDPEPPVPGPESRVPSPEPRAPGPESRVPSPEPPVPSPEPRVPDPESRAPGPEPRAPSPGSRVPDPGSRVLVPQLAAPAPQAQAFGGAGGGRGGGGGVGGGGGRGGRGDAAAQGRIMVDGMQVNAKQQQAAAEAPADTAGWRTLARTEAAALSGMPLYGIGGLTPTLTMLSADNASVRTLYSLESGETLEITQQKLSPQPAQGEATVQGAAATVVADAPVVDVQNARQQQTAPPPAAAGARSDGPAVPSTWTTVRGDLQLTLRGPANASTFGARLRLD